MVAPSGVVSFLFSDVEGSTRLLQQLGDAAYGALLERHRKVIRGSLAAHGGFEVGTEGDSFFVAFSRPDQAVSAALLAQQALHREGLGAAGVRVRMGVHTGQVLLADGEYAGLAVHQAARIAGAAHGGQVLLSATTAELVGADLPQSATLLDLGEHRLKDLDRPHRLMQVCHPDLPKDFPAPRTLELVRHNLPVQTSTFVGRECEMAEVAKLLAAARLVSLLGPGGTGKTRLSYQVAAETVGDVPGGIWVTELATVEEASMVASAVLASLGLREEPGREPTETVVGYLRNRQALIILDNCEQVIAAAAELAQTLLERCPAVRVLVTSREALHVPGEVVYQVPGLALPPVGLPDYLEALAATDAVRLFVTRAVDVRPSFTLTQSNAGDVAAICARLDGLPLAIELAASRARSLSPAQIRERLGTSLDLLSKGARGAQARQATLRGAIDWSHRLLGEAEQALFRRLAVFVGGWPLEAAEQVCAGDGLERGDVLDALDALVDKSLVAVTEDDKGQTRYRLLETIAAYAAERLTEAGEAETLADRHSAWCASLALAASESPAGSLVEAGWFDRLHTDHPNLLAALAHLRGRYSEALELASQLSRFWLNRGHWRIAHDEFHAALAAGSGPSPTRASILGALGQVASNRGDYPEARARYEEALAIARDLGDRRSEGALFTSLGVIASSQGDDPEARGHFEEALAIARTLGNRNSEVACVGNLGVIASNLGDYPEARARAEEALAIARDAGDRRSEGAQLSNLGNLARRLGDYPEARARAEEALAIARDLGNRRSEGHCLGNLGNIALSLGDCPEARVRAEESLAIARELGDRFNEGIQIFNLGSVAISDADCPEARRRFEEALVIARELGDRYSEGLRVGGLVRVAISQGDYSEALARLEEALVLARELQVQYLSVATLDEVAVLLGRVGRHAEALEFLACTDQTRQRTGAARDKAGQESANQTVDAARDLGDEALEHARELGAARSVEEALDIASAKLALIMPEPGQDGSESPRVPPSNPRRFTSAGVVSDETPT